ncbi:SIMPL domain-containing protein [Neisseriaceae bacterium ESL0693]|nr:SIMPL domain-containing protein [Neisseriaceae bacterium ESL0693]
MNHRGLWAFITTVVLITAWPVYAETLNYGLVSLNTTASLPVNRNELVLQLKIEQKGNDREQVSQIVTQRLNQVLRRAHAHHDFNTTQLSRSVYPVSDYKNGTKIHSGWRDQAMVQIKSKNLSALNRFAAEVQQLAMISGMDYQVANDTLRQYQKTLTQQAIDQFKQRAEEISHQLGARSYKIVAISIGNSDSERVSVPLMGLSAARVDDEMPVQDNAAGKTELMLNVTGQIQVY